MFLTDIICGQAIQSGFSMASVSWSLFVTTCMLPAHLSYSNNCVHFDKQRRVRCHLLLTLKLVISPATLKITDSTYLLSLFFSFTLSQFEYVVLMIKKAP